MPLYVADYLRDTRHLRALESGAYIHLIISYWIEGKLPNDDRQLATISRTTDAEWKRIRPIVSSLFGPAWSHKELDAQIAKAADISKTYANRSRHAALARWQKNGSGNA